MKKVQWNTENSYDYIPKVIKVNIFNSIQSNLSTLSLNNLLENSPR